MILFWKKDLSKIQKKKEQTGKLIKPIPEIR
jgi:hypothetical protein